MHHPQKKAEETRKPSTKDVDTTSLFAQPSLRNPPTLGLAGIV